MLPVKDPNTCNAGVKQLSFLIVLMVVAGCTAATTRTPTTPPSGEDLYARNCAACHGPSGEGDGPVASVMTMNVPNLRSLSERNNGEFPGVAVREYIDGRRASKAHGDRYMPVWGTEFRLMQGGNRAADQAADARITALTNFIASIQY